MFDLVYDVSHDYWRSSVLYETLAIPALFVAVCGYEVFRNPEFNIFGFPRPAPQSLYQRLKFPRWFYGIWFVLGLCGLFGLAAVFILTYFILRTELEEGCKIVEGVVGLPTPRASGLVAPGSFSVGGVNVEYEYDSRTEGFRGSRVHRGPVREDLYARACYADIGDRKVVLRLYFKRPE